MKIILGLAVSVLVALNLATPSAGGNAPAAVLIKNTKEARGMAELILTVEKFKVFLPTKDKTEFVITSTLQGNGRTGILAVYEIQKQLLAAKIQYPNVQIYTNGVLLIVREEDTANGETKIGNDETPRPDKRSYFNPLINALTALLPKGLKVIDQDTRTTMKDVLSHITPEKTAVNVDAKIGAGNAKEAIQPKLDLGKRLDMHLKTNGVPLFANDIISGKGASNEHTYSVEPTAVISANQVYKIQRPQGLVLLEKNPENEKAIQKQITEGEQYMKSLKQADGKGEPIKVAYISFKGANTTDDTVQTALAIDDNGVPQNWGNALDLLDVEIGEFELPK